MKSGSRSGRCRAVNIADARRPWEARDIPGQAFLPKPPIARRTARQVWNEGIIVNGSPRKETAEEEKFRDYYAIRKRFARFPRIAPWRCSYYYAGVLKLDLGLGALDARVPASLRRAHCRSLRDGQKTADGAPTNGSAMSVTGPGGSKIALHLSTGVVAAKYAGSRKPGDQDFRRKALNFAWLGRSQGGALGSSTGIRTGCKVAVVDATSRLLETTTILSASTSQ